MVWGETIKKIAFSGKIFVKKQFQIKQLEENIKIKIVRIHAVWA